MMEIMGAIFAFLFTPFLDVTSNNEIYNAFFNAIFTNDPAMWLVSLFPPISSESLFGLILFCILLSIWIILFFIIMLIYIFIPLIAFIIHISIYLLPIIIHQIQKKDSKKDFRYLLPFYNIYLICKDTNTKLSLLIIQILISLVNPPYNNTIIYYFGELKFLHNDIFTLIALLVYVAYNITFFAILIKNSYKTHMKENLKALEKVNNITQEQIPKESATKKDVEVEKKNVLEKVELKVQNPTLAIYQQKEKPVITEKPKKKCPNCGTGNALDAKYCFICNTEFKNIKKY